MVGSVIIDGTGLQHTTPLDETQKEAIEEAIGDTLGVSSDTVQVTGTPTVNADGTVHVEYTVDATNMEPPCADEAACTAQVSETLGENGGGQLQNNLTNQGFTNTGVTVPVVVDVAWGCVASVKLIVGVAVGVAIGVGEPR